jgi:predicted signal transduction protein with EAL and GGDEF domain
LKSSLREVDVVARYGGDEFVVVLSDIQREESVIGFAGKIVDSMRKSFTVNGQPQFVTTSLGISLFPRDGEDIQTLLRNADMAMYRAKEYGRNNFQFFAHDMNVHVSQRLMLENEMRHALDRNEFMLCYQPQADSHSGEIIGMEALLRWHHPVLGLVPPQKFIGLAEETGLIVAIGEWVVHEACRQNKIWQTQGLNKLKVAVNLSVRQFRQHDLVEMISKALQETGLESQYLELELTESMIMHDPERVIHVLNNLSALGLSLALDDFGTGYSSLSYLKRFPIDKIKIDKSFIDHITTDPDDAAIAKAIISIAHEMKMTVIAEGTETEEQVLFLRDQNCNAIQGFFFCKPINAEEMGAFLRSGIRLQIGRYQTFTETA